jgi:hypothetical protein
MPAGVSAAGRSSTDPATARKVEAKKREKRKYRRPGRGAAGRLTVGHDCACHGHGRGYSRRNNREQVPRHPGQTQNNHTIKLYLRKKRS